MNFSLNFLYSALIVVILLSSQGGRATLGNWLYIFFTLLATLIFLSRRFEEVASFFQKRQKVMYWLGAGLLLGVIQTIYLWPSSASGLLFAFTFIAHFGNLLIFTFAFSSIDKKRCLQGLALLSIFFVISLTGNFDSLFFPNQNLLADYLAGAFWIFFFAYLAQDKRFSWHLLFLIGLGFSLYKTGSRGVLLALLVVHVIFTVLRPQKFLTAFAILAAGGILCFILFPSKIRVDRWLHPTQNQHLKIWQSAFNSIQEHPYLGWGFQHFQLAYERHKLPENLKIGQYERTTRFAHNEFLQLWVEGGTAFILWSLVGLIIFFLFLRQKWKQSETSIFPQTLTAIAAILTMFFHSCFDFNFHLPALGLVFVFYLSLLLQPSHEIIHVTYKKIVWILLIAATAFSFTACILEAAGIGLHYSSTEKFSTKILRSLSYFPLGNANILATLARKTERTEAEKSLRQAALYPASNIWASQDLARFYRSIGEKEKSMIAYQEALRLTPKYPFLYVEASELADDWQEKMALLDAAIRAEPLYVEPYRRKAEILNRLGRPEEAMLNLQIANTITKQSQNQHAESDYEAAILKWKSTHEK